jgi:hypothetical protein
MTIREQIKKNKIAGSSENRTSIAGATAITPLGNIIK